MKPINFKEATKVLQRPSTMTDAECASIHVWSDGKQCVSCWKPSVLERVRILFGGKVYLGVKGGGTQPPVFVTGECPFNRLSVAASIIAGNKTIENAANIGLDKVIVVETDGNQIVAVKRKDIDLDSEKGREMALADNATSDANLQWDENAIENITARWNDIKPEDWGIDLAQPEEEEEKEDVKKELSTKLVVQCANVSQLSLLYSELQDRGFICELKE